MSKITYKNNNCTCKKCGTSFVFMPDEIKWYDFGTYSVKTVKCSDCGCVNELKYEDAAGLYTNNDRRLYFADAK